MRALIGCLLGFAIPLGFGCRHAVREARLLEHPGVRWRCVPPAVWGQGGVPGQLRDWTAQATTTAGLLGDAERATWHLPHLPDGRVTAVADPATCARAGAAYWAGRHLPPGRYTVAVVQAGDRYVATDVDAVTRAGGLLSAVILDETFRPLVRYTR